MKTTLKLAAVLLLNAHWVHALTFNEVSPLASSGQDLIYSPDRGLYLHANQGGAALELTFQNEQGHVVETLSLPQTATALTWARVNALGDIQMVLSSAETHWFYRLESNGQWVLRHQTQHAPTEIKIHERVWLFQTTQDDTFWLLDQQAQNLGVEGQLVCFLDPSTIYFSDEGIYRYDGQTISQVEPGHQLKLGEASFAQSSDACLLILEDGNGERKLFHATADGLSEKPATLIEKVAELDDTFIKVARDPNTFNRQLQALDADSLATVKAVRIDLQDEVSFQEGLAAVSDEQVSKMYDEQLDLLFTHDLTAGRQFGRLHEQIFELDDQNIYLYDSPTSFSKAFLPVAHLSQNGGVTACGESICIHANNKSQAVGSPQAVSYFKLESKPRIGEQLNGAWLAPELLNQGMQIQSGQRSDGSRYVFLTFYLYDQGQPLWLAGLSDYTVGVESIDVTLYQYQGAGFLDPVSQPNQTVLGEVQLQFTACNNLQATLQVAGQTHHLLLNRMDDQQFALRCSE